MPYFPSSELERQVYVSSSKMSVLTNKRLVEVSQMRPIDKLFNLLVSICDSGKAMAGKYDDFMDFATTYTMEETCTMLV